jgi:hypothetical protein
MILDFIARWKNGVINGEEKMHLKLDLKIHEIEMILNK